MTTILTAQGLGLAGRLQPTDLSLEGGRLTCLIGPNGSGKTSLLHAIAGVGRPSGSVRIEAVDPWRLGPGQRVRLLSYLPASRDVAWPILARDVLALGGPKGESCLVEELEIEPLLDRRLDSLSTGERSRVLIARALAAGSRLLLLDEPTANLDPLWQIRLMEGLRDRTRATGQGALIALHDLDLANRYADRLLIMAGGRIAADGEPKVLLAGPAMEDVFGIRRVDGKWVPARREDRQSSP